MEKDFDKWNKVKKVIENNSKKLLFNEGEIWWVTVGLNSRQELCGKGENFRRPVLILKKLSSNIFIGIPLSSKIKVGSWFLSYFQNGIKYTALLYQIKMFDIGRFQRRMGQMDEKDFLEIKKKLKNLLNL